MRNPGGYAVIVDPNVVAPWERDTCMCGHCGRVIFVKPGTASTVYLINHRDGRWTEEAGAFCRCCMKPVCLSCHAVGTCQPLERWLETQERKPALQSP
jgi:hypothetical protein